MKMSGGLEGWTRLDDWSLVVVDVGLCFFVSLDNQRWKGMQLELGIFPLSVPNKTISDSSRGL